MKPSLCDLAGVVGFALFIWGVALWSIPLALSVGGAWIMVAAIAGAKTWDTSRR